jgi:ATP-dependent Clp protease ATP-binding subunit ClpA
MPKINVYLPDELAEAVKATGVPVSAVCQRALEQAVRRLTAIRARGLDEWNLDDPDPGGRLARFTAKARASIKIGMEQAQVAGASDVGTEHLLSGILAEGTNLAIQVLRAMEIEPAEVRRQLERQAATGGTDGTDITDSSDGTDGTDDSGADEPSSRLSGPGAAVLEFAVTEAISLGHNYIGCEHLLLGLVAEQEGTGGKVLRALGAEQRLTRRAVAASLAGYVHLKAQLRDTAPPPAAAASTVAAAVRQELQPFVERLERLEERLADPA